MEYLVEPNENMLNENMLALSKGNFKQLVVPFIENQTALLHDLNGDDIRFSADEKDKHVIEKIKTSILLENRNTPCRKLSSFLPEFIESFKIKNAKTFKFIERFIQDIKDDKLIDNLHEYINDKAIIEQLKNYYKLANEQIDNIPIATISTVEKQEGGAEHIEDIVSNNIERQYNYYTILSTKNYDKHINSDSVFIYIEFSLNTGTDNLDKIKNLNEMLKRLDRDLMILTNTFMKKQHTIREKIKKSIDDKKEEEEIKKLVKERKELAEMYKKKIEEKKSELDGEIVFHGKMNLISYYDIEEGDSKNEPRTMNDVMKAYNKKKSANKSRSIKVIGNPIDTVIKFDLIKKKITELTTSNGGPLYNTNMLYLNIENANNILGSDIIDDLTIRYKKQKDDTPENSKCHISLDDMRVINEYKLPAGIAEFKALMENSLRDTHYYSVVADLIIKLFNECGYEVNWSIMDSSTPFYNYRNRIYEIFESNSHLHRVNTSVSLASLINILETDIDQTTYRYLETINIFDSEEVDYAVITTSFADVDLSVSDLTENLTKKKKILEDFIDSQKAIVTATKNRLVFMIGIVIFVIIICICLLNFAKIVGIIFIIIAGARATGMEPWLICMASIISIYVMSMFSKLSEFLQSFFTNIYEYVIVPVSNRFGVKQLIIEAFNTQKYDDAIKKIGDILTEADVQKMENLMAKLKNFNQENDERTAKAIEDVVNKATGGARVKKSTLKNKKKFSKRRALFKSNKKTKHKLKFKKYIKTNKTNKKNKMSGGGRNTFIILEIMNAFVNILELFMFPENYPIYNTSSVFDEIYKIILNINIPL